ncbi:ethanolamine kinase A [Phytophthora cinnamomi]|uniref:ethanolamine kinase A n=1 Tax=Phytophthora cinnamomi TaxID=4785 RepID=UPI0035597C16|nr:ethanolamine kinase A [Phytophthora cinnamomi]
MAISTARLAARSLQTLFALLALIFTWGGYVKNDDGQLSGLSPEFSILMNYSAFLTGLYYVLPVKILKWTAVAPSVNFQRLVDGVLVVLLLLGAILLWASSGVKDCSEKNDEYEAYAGLQLFRCGNLTMGVIFTFITFALFLVTLIWSFVSDNASTTKLRLPLLLDTRRPLLRFVLSLLIFISTVAGYKHYFTGRFTSPVAMFMVLVSWSCILYTLFHLVVVDILKKSHRPSAGIERFLDLLLAVLLLLFAILLAASHQVSDCDTINAKYEADTGSLGGSNVYRCGSLTRAYVLAFIDCVFFLATLALGFFGSADSEPAPRHVDVEPGQQV